MLQSPQMPFADDNEQKWYVGHLRHLSVPSNNDEFWRTYDHKRALSGYTGAYHASTCREPSP